MLILFGHVLIVLCKMFDTQLFTFYLNNGVRIGICIRNMYLVHDILNILYNE